MSSTTVRIGGERKLIAEAVAVSVATKLKKPVKTSEIVHFVLDKHLTPEITDQFVEEYRKKEKEKK
jgi:RNA 3'-terminal phosphate cyclase